VSGQAFRLPAGGRIERAQPLEFRFDGRAYRGYRGDTLASALLANGVRLVGRSFKYHRPRGVFAAGAEEPNALVELGAGWRREPNTRATQVELFDGLTASSQNRWPSLRYDAGALAGLVAPFLPAGFYYKTFMWPRGAWHFYERYIRRAAGLGRAAEEADLERYDKRYAHCDVLVAGGGPAGITAALAAARAGARVILAEQDFELGGALLGAPARIGDAPALDWVAGAREELAGCERMQVLLRTTVFGHYDHGLLGLVERLADQRPGTAQDVPRQRLWRVRAAQVVIATGAFERPLVFPDNDRPGVMLASAARTYANRYAVRPGSRALVFTNNDSGWEAAADLHAAGVAVAVVADARPGGWGPAAARAQEAGIAAAPGTAVVGTRGGRHLRGVTLGSLEGGGPRRHVACDLLAVSGGWSPALHLHAHARGRPVWDAHKAAFVPGARAQAERAAGAAAGTWSLSGCLQEGLAAGAAAAAEAGFGDGKAPPAPAVAEDEAAPLRPLWQVPGAGKCFVDLQTDVTVGDVALAAREGYRSVEHVKRYTTLGMGTEQGKTGNVNGLAVLAEVLGAEIPAVGYTTFRPPYTPVTLGALAGRESAARLDPVRRTPMHAWHERHGAVFMPAGLWRRARYYPRGGEGIAAASLREARAVRSGVGMVDVSTLGKIDIQGPDAAEFLNRVYVNGWKSLEVGRARYGIMLREDGIVFDDGTTTRLGEHHYLMTTTTANAGRVMGHLERYLQVHWPELRVQVVSVTDQWAAMALAGPRSRRVLERVVENIDVGNEAFPFMGYREGAVAGVPARVFRISFSGELGYEINVPADYGLAVWEALMVAGEAEGIVAYGVEAMDLLRVEKGHLVVGADIDGRVTPYDLGLERMLSTRKAFIGQALLARPAFHEPARERLVGLRSADGHTPIPAGAQIVADPDAPAPQTSLGRVTSPAWSPELDTSVALALVSGGLTRRGETLYAVAPLEGEQAAVVVTNPVFVDPEGERLRG